MKTVQEWADYRRAHVGWPLAHFTPEELATAGSSAKQDTLLKVHWPSATALDTLRGRLRHPLVVNSAYRSPAHNAAVGGAARSMHLQGRAFDIARSSIRDEAEFLIEAWRLGFRGFGFYDGFIHIDTGGKRTWDERSNRSKPHPIPWGLPGAHDDGELPADIRTIPAPPRPPESARPSTHAGTGLAAGGGVVLIQQAEEVADYVKGQGDAPIFAGLAAVIMAAAFGFVIWRLVKGRRAEREDR